MTIGASTGPAARPSLPVRLWRFFRGLVGGWRESVIDGLADVRTNKLRTFLQTLGVVLGVASLVAVQGLADAGRRKMVSFWSELGGLTKLLVVNKPPKETVVSARQLASSGLTWDDVQAIRREVKHAVQVDPILRARMIVKQGDYLRGREISGATPDYPAVYKFYPARGRFITDDDMEAQKRVVVLGDTAAREYFGNEDPIGRTLYLGDVGLTVVGVMRRKEFYFNEGDNNALEWMNRQTLVPLTAIYTRFTGDEQKHVNYINVIVDKVDHNEQTVKAVATVLYRRHGGVQDFEVVNRSAQMARARQQGQVSTSSSSRVSPSRSSSAGSSS